MGVSEFLGALAAIILALLPVILAHLRERKKETDALTRKSIDELHVGTDSLRARPPLRPE